MPRVNIISSVFIAVVMSSFSQSRATEIADTLQTNPFSNPINDERETTADPARDTLPPVALELRGTMIAGPNSQANIGGIILAIGDAIEGYKLVSIKQRHVVLDKNGAHKMLSLDLDDSE